MSSFEITMLAGATGVAVASASAGVLIAGAASRSRRVITFSAGLLIGISVFGVLPELADKFGWTVSPLLLLAGFLLLWAINRYVYPVCPACSHSHDHDHCALALHGFAGPLLVAAGIHSFLDGLGIAASLRDNPQGLGLALPLVVAVHKMPEGLALGAMMRASVGTRGAAFGLATLAELFTLFGGATESYLVLHGGVNWVSLCLAMVGGSFLFLGWHAVQAEWRRRGPIPAVVAALGGAAGAAAIQQGLRVLLR